MFAPKQQTKPTKTRTGILIEEFLLNRLDQIVEVEKDVRSRNEVISTLLEFGTDFYEAFGPLSGKVLAFAEKEELTYGQAVALLAARGLKSKP